MAQPQLQQELAQQLAAWDRVVRDRPQAAQAYVRRGMVRFQLAQIAAAIADFDQAERLQPQLTPYLWQRGLAYYYAGQFAEGATQFATDLQVNGQDVEETVWHCLCMAQLKGFAAAQQELLPVGRDRRPGLRAVYDLFAGRCEPTVVLQLGTTLGVAGQFYSQLYVGLHAEAQGDATTAQAHLTQAANDWQLDDYMWHLARVHCQLRGWA